MKERFGIAITPGHSGVDHPIPRQDQQVMTTPEHVGSRGDVDAQKAARPRCHQTRNPQSSATTIITDRPGTPGGGAPTDADRPPFVPAGGGNAHRSVRHPKLGEPQAMASDRVSTQPRPAVISTRCQSRISSTARPRTPDPTCTPMPATPIAEAHEWHCDHRGARR